MASILSLTRQALRPVCRRQLAAATTSLLAQRSLHASPITLKKKKNAVQEVEFDDFAFEEDELVSIPAEEPSAKGKQVKASLRGQLTPEQREKRFDELFDFVKAHIGRQPTADDPKQVRTSAWTHLIQLATSEEQLKRVADAFADWTTVGREFKEEQAVLFVQRCNQLKCPTLAVDVFSNRPYYRFDLKSVEAARELLHSVYKDSLFKESVLVSTLFTLYNLPPLANDIVSCSMLLSQCLAVDTPESRVIAGALLPAFKQSIDNSSPMPLPTDPASRKQGEERHLSWLKNAAGTIDSRLRARGEDTTWLRKWRVASGHIPSAGQAHFEHQEQPRQRAAHA
ncbi:hypothetical protein PENSPDRAFT_622544 [Peniophora sp. CONT]|nr:hypothetical protein PENSPDRAFT_622544 [Peniophora sp. CONT]